MDTLALLTFVFTFLVGATAGAWLNSLTTETRRQAITHRLRE
jgi:hypothetical protein